MNILTIGYTTEGKTDERFLGNIIRKTFELLAFECTGEIEVYEPQHILIKEDTFVDSVIEASKIIPWANVLCIHTDADANTAENVIRYKINPSITAINSVNGQVCKNLVPIVPIQMTEAWMLADIDLLKETISTTKSNQELGLPNHTKLIEQLDNPKFTIENAIRVAFIEYPKRRSKLNISELYSPISQKIDISILNSLPSYLNFKNKAKEALRFLNYLI